MPTAGYSTNVESEKRNPNWVHGVQGLGINPKLDNQVHKIENHMGSAKYVSQGRTFCFHVTFLVLAHTRVLA